MAEPRLAKHIAIALGGIEFLFGLFFGGILLVQALFYASDPNQSDPWLWPFYASIILLFVGGPLALAYFAERSSNARTVYACLAVLVLYPVATIAWANFIAD